MTQIEFITEYGRRLLRPLTKVTAAELYEAYVGYSKGDFKSKWAKLAGRDQHAVLLMYNAIHEKGYIPQRVSPEDLKYFDPNKDRQCVEQCLDDDYSEYIEFINLVAENFNKKGTS